MTLATVRTTFQGILNRTDCTNAQADIFLNLGLMRVQRRLRIPTMERMLTATASGSAEPSIALPNDVIELMDVIPRADGAKPLERLSYRALIQRPFSEGDQPKAYARLANVLHFRPAIPDGGIVDVLYYGEFGPLNNDSDENGLTRVAPDLFIYSALVFAGDHYTHDKRQEWAQTFEGLLAEMNDMAAQEAKTGGVQAVEPMYYDPGSY